jgi:hypothetical protein
MEQTGCSETLEYKIQTPGNYPEESIQLELLTPNFRYGTWVLTVRQLIIFTFILEVVSVSDE